MPGRSTNDENRLFHRYGACSSADHVEPLISPKQRYSTLVTMDFFDLAEDRTSNLSHHPISRFRRGAAKSVPLASASTPIELRSDSTMTSGFCPTCESIEVIRTVDRHFSLSFLSTLHALSIGARSSQSTSPLEEPSQSHRSTSNLSGHPGHSCQCSLTPSRRFCIVIPVGFEMVNNSSCTSHSMPSSSHAGCINNICLQLASLLCNASSSRALRGPMSSSTSKSQ